MSSGGHLLKGIDPGHLCCRHLTGDHQDVTAPGPLQEESLDLGQEEGHHLTPPGLINLSHLTGDCQDTQKKCKEKEQRQPQQVKVKIKTVLSSQQEGEEHG